MRLICYIPHLEPLRHLERVGSDACRSPQAIWSCQDQANLSSSADCVLSAPEIQPPHPCATRRRGRSRQGVAKSISRKRDEPQFAGGARGPCSCSVETVSRTLHAMSGLAGVPPTRLQDPEYLSLPVRSNGLKTLVNSSALWSNSDPMHVRTSSAGHCPSIALA